MPKTNRYAVFGLTVESELELPELPKTNAAADAFVVFGKTPEHLENPGANTPWLELKAGQFLLTVDVAGRYYAENGKRIVVEPFAGADADDLRTFLYDSAFAALMQQRGVLALHGAAAVIGGKAAAIIGISSVGKSAVALALYQKGYLLLADEICAVGLRDGHAAVFPGIPKLSLWNDALITAGIDPEGLRPVRRKLEKYSFPVGDQSACASAALSHIFLLTHHNQSEPCTEPVRGGNKLEKLLQHQFYLETAHDQAQHFALCVTAASVPMTQINFHGSKGEADKVADIIQKEMGV